MESKPRKKSIKFFVERIVSAGDLKAKYPDAINKLSTSGFAVAETCSVCLESGYSDAEPRAFMSCCSHDFHFECIHKWCTAEASTCPLCKNEVASIALLRIAEGVGDGEPIEEMLLGVREVRVKKKQQECVLDPFVYGVATEEEQNVSLSCRLLVAYSTTGHF